MGCEGWGVKGGVGVGRQYLGYMSLGKRPSMHGFHSSPGVGVSWTVM